MANQKYIKADKKSKVGNDIGKYDLSVMKPFVKFGIGAVKVLAHTFVFIVKAALKLRPEEAKPKTNGKVIKL